MRGCEAEVSECILLWADFLCVCYLEMSPESFNMQLVCHAFNPGALQMQEKDTNCNGALQHW